MDSRLKPSLLKLIVTTLIITTVVLSVIFIGLSFYMGGFEGNSVAGDLDGSKTVDARGSGQKNHFMDFSGVHADNGAKVDINTGSKTSHKTVNESGN